MFNVQELLNADGIVEDLEAALEQFREIVADLGAETADTDKQSLIMAGEKGSGVFSDQLR